MYIVHSTGVDKGGTRGPHRPPPPPRPLHPRWSESLKKGKGGLANWGMPLHITYIPLTMTPPKKNWYMNFQKSPSTPSP